MGEIVNLRSVKKAKARDAAKQVARENRVRHGRTAAEKANDRLAAERVEKADNRLREEPDHPD